MSVCCCLVHAAVAFYNPQMGRWMTRDPIEEKGGNKATLKNNYYT